MWSFSVFILNCDAWKSLIMVVAFSTIPDFYDADVPLAKKLFQSSVFARRPIFLLRGTYWGCLICWLLNDRVKFSSSQTCLQKKIPLYGFTKPYSFHFSQNLSLNSLKKFHAPRNSILKTWAWLLNSLNHPGTRLNFGFKPINLPLAGTTELYF